MGGKMATATALTTSLYLNMCQDMVVCARWCLMEDLHDSLVCLDGAGADRVLDGVRRNVRDTPVQLVQ